jgi:hypothetical protein
MALCCWLDPFIIARIEFLEWHQKIDCVIPVSPDSAATKLRVMWFANEGCAGESAPRAIFLQ